MPPETYITELLVVLLKADVRTIMNVDWSV